MSRLPAISLFLSILLTGCEWEKNIDGGPCTYDDFPGTCTGEGDGLFTFEGDINGAATTLSGNTLDDADALPSGESVSCTLSVETDGTCTPCLFDIGQCGDEAWDVEP